MMSLCASNIVQIGIGARASVTVYALLAELTPDKALVVGLGKYPATQPYGQPNLYR